MKTPKLIVALTAVVLIPTGAYSQFRPAEPIRPIQPITVPAIPNIQPIPSYSAAPSYSTAPSYSAAPSHTIVPSEQARAEDAKIRKAASDRIFQYQRVILTDTTRVTAWDDGATYSVSAFFTVQGQNVAIRFISTAKAAAEAFLDYINRIFHNDSSTDRSLEMIVADAHRYLRDLHRFSEDQITLRYIDQFNETHVVLVSRGELKSMLASH